MELFHGGRKPYPLLHQNQVVLGLQKGTLKPKCDDSVPDRVRINLEKMYSIKNRCKACGAMDAWSDLFDEQIGEIIAKESNCGGSDVEAQF